MGKDGEVQEGAERVEGRDIVASEAEQPQGKDFDGRIAARKARAECFELRVVPEERCKGDMLKVSVLR